MGVTRRCWRGRLGVWFGGIAIGSALRPFAGLVRSARALPVCKVRLLRGGLWTIRRGGRGRETLAYGDGWLGPRLLSRCWRFRSTGELGIQLVVVERRWCRWFVARWLRSRGFRSSSDRSRRLPLSFEPRFCIGRWF